ncbi:2-oxo acid dehydrogenase subunit E2 [Oceanisphaera sp.]|uniref:2-oxo acid dehydrogenase subunit E2 n=1 Tax=Oceanisphaera sp. TaxID=1929979 RepID=UPI003A8FB029
MKQDFYLPDIGEGIVECELVEWLVAEGDTVVEDQAICDVMTDKALVQIPAIHNGVISKLYVAKGEMARVHAPLFAMELSEAEQNEPSGSSVVEQPEPQVAKAVPVSAPPPDSPPQATQDKTHIADERPAMNSGKALASPAVRRLAREQDVILSEVPGSGEKGRVYKEDITAYLAQQDQSRAKQTEPETHTEPLTGIAAAMSKQMTASLQVPQFTLCDELALDELLAMKDKLTPLFAEQGITLTLLPFFLKALSLALHDFPKLNSQLNASGTQVTYQPRHHIGVAVNTDAGLLVPVLRDCQQQSLLSIAAELERLTQAARAGRLTPVELQGATITLSNIGALGGLVSSPIVNPPQVAIAALGHWQRLPRFNEQEELEAKALMMLCWSADHRLIDGATLARFNRCWCRYLEQPARMLAQLR